MQRPAITKEMIAEINQRATTWQAGMNERFRTATVRDVAVMLGTKMPGQPGYEELPPRALPKRVAALPESFDVREHWPQCASVTGQVRDQSSCGSCWAFGSTEAFNDRMCIAHGLTELLSPTDTLACCSGARCGFSNGCNGGQPSGAWKWFVSDGVVSGGLYGDESTCLPYPFPACAHHVDPTPEYPACPSDEYKTPKCVSSCSTKSYAVDYPKDKVKAKTAYSVKSVDDMMQELYQFGTLSVALTVYEDFEAYTSGVYQHVYGRSLGGHAVKMVGWGVDNGTPYWTCVNSWNDSWGEGGVFRILRGSNECGIEGSVVAGEV